MHKERILPHMKIVVFSDSHGKCASMKKIIERNKSADLFLHLGDGADSFLSLASEMGVFARAVRGNCDVWSGSASIPFTDIFTVEGKKIFMTHGHLHSVGASRERLILSARENEADIVLYGHTHVKENLYIDCFEKPIYLMNPGSIERPRDGSYSFGYIEIKKGVGVITNTAEFTE